MSDFPAVGGMPSTSGTQSPTLYALKLLEEFYNSTFLTEISNTKYEGKIKKQGDKVRIRTLPALSIHDFVKGQDLEYENPEPGYIDLDIDKGLYWGIALDDIDMTQFDYDPMSNWQPHASIGLKEELETRLLANIYAQVHAANAGAAAGAISGAYGLGASSSAQTMSATNAADIITRCGATMDEQNVPAQGRYVVLPAWATRHLKLDLKDASMTGDNTSTVRTGRVGIVDNMTVYQSNLLSTVTDTGAQVTNAIFGHPCALTFATQITKTETLRNFRTFGDIARSLLVYGYKVVKPEALGHLYIKAA